jgi:2-C-methyl-D-erythritol 4-phosphate cytidylyltransferase
MQSLSRSLLLLWLTALLQALSIRAFAPRPASTSLYQPSLHSSSSLQAASSIIDSTLQQDKTVSFVILAGGKGSRMKANMPKQFLPLQGVPVLHYSLDLFLNQWPRYCQQDSLCVLVIDPVYQDEYKPLVDKYPGRLGLASPGVERQGSVENGLTRVAEMITAQGKSLETAFVAIHDSARPLVTLEEIDKVVKDAYEYGAAVLGVPCKATIKESDNGKTVLRTIPRARLWEVHTPQVISIPLLQRGFAKVAAENLEVTDDVSIVEALGEPVKLTLGEYTNLKITTPEDMDVATAILEERRCKPVNMLATV